MTEKDSRTGAVRDVPPPRPLPPSLSAAPAEENPLGRAARVVADAVAGLIGTAPGPADGADGRRAAASGLRDVLGAVAGAVGGAFAAGRADGSGRDEPPAASAERTPGALLGDLLSATVPRLPIRDGDRLRQAYPGATEDDIAEALVARSARLTSGIGAAVGGLSAAQWFAPPSLLALPLELGAETVLIAGVEVVLLGELHELYGRPAPGEPRARAAAYLASWTAQTSVQGLGGTGIASLLGSAGVRALRRRVTRKLAVGIPSAAPFLIGAAIAGRSNRRATESLARRVLEELRGTARPGA